MSQDCDSQAETTWREREAAPVPAACPARAAWTQAAQSVNCFYITLVWHQRCKANWHPAALPREQGAAVWGTTDLQPQPAAPGAVEAVRGTCRSSVRFQMNYSCYGLETDTRILHIL